MPESRVLRERVAGQSAMAHVVAAQSGEPVRTPIATLFGVSPLRGESRASYREALAELLVGDALESLGQRWDLLHDLPLGDGVLDHLAIGPAGAFAVHTMHANGEDVVVDGDELSVGGEPRNDLDRAREAALEVASRLRAGAEPLVVVVGARRLVHRGASSVPVVGAAEVGRMLARAPQVLSGDEVARLSDLADLESTWPRAGAAALDTQALHRDFAGIRSIVNEARGRRVIWGAAAVGLAYGGVWALVASLVSLIAGS